MKPSRSTPVLLALATAATLLVCACSLLPRNLALKCKVEPTATQPGELHDAPTSGPRQLLPES